MKTIIKKLSRRFGVEIRRFSPTRSDLSRMQRIFSHFNIDLVLDVGANAGQYAKLLREIGYAGRIVSFEPLASAHSQLLAASKNDSLWDIAPRSAIGNVDGEISINISHNSFSSSVLPMLDAHLQNAPNSAYVRSELVNLYKLDTIAPRFIDDACKAIFLKVDVQGYEAQVIEGAARTLPSIKGVQLELSLVPLYEGEPLYRDMLERMDQLGYDLYAVIPGFTDENSGRLLQMDGIFIRK